MWTGKVSWFHAIYDRWWSYENIMLGSCLYCLLFHSWVFWLNLKAKSRVMFLIKYQFSRAASSYFLLAWPRVHILCHFLTKIKKNTLTYKKITLNQLIRHVYLNYRISPSLNFDLALWTAWMHVLLLRYSISERTAKCRSWRSKESLSCY